ncbi:MAG: SRPBCC domain-containing protein [Nitriliruptorales bacterium]|nr:SRPBCC domain-containing protein [Nitriliruptorales bacterium]
MNPTNTDPVVKRRVVSIDTATAFELFTRRLEEWWPLDTHSVSGHDLAGVRFEERVGGRVLEVTPDGARYSWADVVAWDPPYRFALSWHPTPEPVAASRIEVTFSEAESGTIVNIHHSGWKEFNRNASRLRNEYDRGWEVVLAAFTAAAD